MKIEQLTTEIVNLPLAKPIKTAIHDMRSVGCVLVRIKVDGVEGQGYCFALNGVRIKAFDEIIKSYSPLVVEQPLIPWLEIVIEEDEYLSDLQSPIQAMVEGYDLDVLRIRRLRKTGEQALQQHTRETLDELDVAEVFERRLALEELSEDNQKLLIGLHAELVEAQASANRSEPVAGGELTK